jgi:tRNA A37 threonylcarbamoyladenosine modification protein TsaB
VCTLDILAAAVTGPGAGGVVAGATPVGAAGSRLAGGFAVATDARRREVYWAAYGLTGRRETEPAVDRPGELVGRLQGLPIAGEGPRLYPEQFPDPIDPTLPSAAVLADLTAQLLRDDPAALLPPQPLYLRRPDAVEPAARKPVSQA